MLIDFILGQTSVVLRVKISNAGGTGVTGLSSSSTGLIISTAADNEASATAYTAAGSTIETIATLGTFATPTATKCRFKEFDATNHPGVYEVQIANARFAVSSAKSLLISINEASGIVDCDVVVPLRSINPYSTGFGLVNASANTVQFLGHAVVLDGNNYPGINVVDVAGSAASTATPPTAAQVATAVWEDTTAGGDFVTSGSIGKLLIGTNMLDGVVVESGLNARQALSIIAAAVAGVSSGSGTVFAGAGVATNRITATATAGNRSVVTLHPPA